MDGVTIPATCRVWLPCGSLRRERERQAVTVSPLERKKMLASVCSSRRVVPPMEPPHTAKAFPNCGQESHTLVQVLTLILKITVLTPNSGEVFTPSFTPANVRAVILYTGVSHS